MSVLDLPGLRTFKRPGFRFAVALLLLAAALLVHVGDVAGALHNWTSTADTQPAADVNDWIQADRIFLSGGSPYQPMLTYGPEKFAPGATTAYYTPTFFLLLAPMTHAPAWLRYSSWLLLEEAALVVVVLSAWAGMGKPSRVEAAVTLALCLPFLPLRQNLFEGQLDLVVLALAAAALLACQRRRPVLGGTAFAFAVILKPTLLPLLLLFAYRRWWRMLAATAVSGAVLVLFSFALGHGHQWVPLYQLLSPLGRGSAFIANQSVNGLLLRAWRPDFSGQPIPPLPGTFFLAWYAIEAVVIGLVLLGLRRGGPEVFRDDWLLFAVFLLLLGVLQPLGWFHHHVGAIVAILVGARLVATRQVGWRAAAGLLMGYFLVTVVAYPIHVAARPLGGQGLYSHPWLRWGTSTAFVGFMVAMFVLAYARPRRVAMLANR